MVMRVVVGEPLTVTVAGEKLQLAFAGSPEHANDTALSNPFVGDTVSVEVTDEPSVTVSVCGTLVTVNPGCGVTTVMVSGAELDPW